MSILFVLLTFLLILTIMYFRRPETPAVALQPISFEKVAVPKMLRTSDVQVPQGYAFHPGHTWVNDEGHQNARVGIDAFAGDLFGQIDGIEMAELNRWVRQGQKLCTVKHGEKTIDMLSPVEGVVISLNHEVLKNPSLITSDPYRNGWICVVKAPELSTNTKNLLQGPLVPAWMQNSLVRVRGMMQQLNPAFAQDGGLPIKGMLFQLDAGARQQVIKEFFLT
jgi:glycine cleavage system H lipoate-binding protein